MTNEPPIFDDPKAEADYRARRAARLAWYHMDHVRSEVGAFARQVEQYQGDLAFRAELKRLGISDRLWETFLAANSLFQASLWGRK
jgi:hypothetical protein